jgi:hypothetical protein
MTANLANPTALSFWGVAKDTGTYVAPTDYIPLTKFDPEDMTTWINDDATRGSMVKSYDKIAGPVWSKATLGGPVFPDTIGYPLMGMLGDVTASGASAPYTYAGAIKNSGDGQPTSQSWTDFNSVEPRGFVGSRWYDLNFAWDGEKGFTWDGAFQGFQSVIQAKPTNAPSTIRMLPGWLCVFKVGGSTLSTLVSADIKMKRAGEPINTADGTQAPLEIFVGEIEVTGKCVLVADVNTQMTNYLSATQTTFDFNFTQGAGAALVQTQFHGSKVNYDLAKPVRGKRFVEYEITWEMLGNSTDAGASGGFSPLKATIQNAKATNVYV